MIDNEKKDIYRNYHSKVYGYILSKLNIKEDAEDLTEDVFIKVFENIENFDVRKASLSTWIYTITKNTVIDYFRKSKPIYVLSDTLQDNTFIEDELCNNETLEKLADGLEKLEKRERSIIILHYYLENTLIETADKLGISYAYVKVLKNKALKVLKEYLENE